MAINLDAIQERNKVGVRYNVPPQESQNSDNVSLTKYGEKATGRENDTEGFWNIAGENIIGGSMDVAGSIAATFGNTQFASKMEAARAANKDFDEKTIREDGFGSWLGQSLGQAAPDIAGAVGAGAIVAATGGAAIIGTAGFSFVRMSGANYRMMRKWRPDADVGEVRAHAYGLGMVQAAIEQLGGMETLAVKKLLAGRTVNSLAKDMAESSTRKGTMNFMQKTLVSSKNRAASVAKSAYAEFTEEQLQAVAEIVSGKTWGKQEYSGDDLFRMLLEEPARALPAGGLMGGAFHHANDTGKSSASMEVVSQETEASMFARDDGEGGFVVDEAALNLDNEQFAALEKELGRSMGNSAKAAVSQIKSLAYAMSFAAQISHDSSLMPADFIKTLKTGYSEGKAGPADIAAIEKIRDNANLSTREKGEQVLEHIAKAHGENSEFYKTISGVSQNVEADSIARSTNDLIKQYERYATPLDTSAKKDWTTKIESTIQSIFQARYLKKGDVESVLYNDISDEFSTDDIARIFLENPIIAIDGVRYSVLADENGLSLMKADEFQADFADTVGQFLGLIENQRKDAHPTGGAMRLAHEKALHGIVESKYIVAQIKAAFDARTDPTGAQKAEASKAAKLDAEIEQLEKQRAELNKDVSEGKITKEEAQDQEADIDESEERVVDQAAEVAVKTQTKPKSKAKIRGLEKKISTLEAKKPKKKRGKRSKADSAADAKIDQQIENVRKKIVSEDQVVAKVDSEEAVTATQDKAVEASEKLVEQFDALSKELAADEAEVAAEAKVDEEKAPEGEEVTEEVAEEETDDTEEVESGEVSALDDDVKYIILERDQAGIWELRQIEQDGNIAYEAVNLNRKSDSFVFASLEETEGVLNNPVKVNRVVNKKVSRKKRVTKENREKINQFKNEISTMVNMLKKALAIGNRLEITSLIGEIGNKMKSAGIDNTEGVLAEFGLSSIAEVKALAPIEEEASSLSEEVIHAEAAKLGVTADVDRGIVTVYDPQTDNAFEVESGKSLKESVEKLRFHSQFRKVNNVTPDTVGILDDRGVTAANLEEKESENSSTVGEMTDEEIIAEGEKLGMLFQGFQEGVNWPVFVDPENESSFMVDDDTSVVSALNAHRARTAAAKEQAALFDAVGQQIKGMYIPTERTAIFFAGADVETAVHEFVHHAKSILPLQMQTDLLAEFERITGHKANGWTMEADEWLAMSMTKWIVGKSQPFRQGDIATVAAYTHARNIVMTAYKDFNLSEDTKAGLDKIFGEIPDSDAVFGAKQAMDSMIFQDPITPDMVSGLFAGRSGSRFDTKENEVKNKKPGDTESSVRFDMAASDVESNNVLTSDYRKGIYNSLHAIHKDHAAVNEFAKSVFGNTYVSLNALTDDEVALLLHASKTSKISTTSDAVVSAERDGNLLFESAKVEGAKLESVRNVSSDSQAVKMLNAIRQKLRSSGNAAKILVSSMDSTVKILDGMSDTGVWHNLISKPIVAAREVRVTLAEKYQQSFSKSIRKRGLRMRKIQAQTVSIDGSDYKKGEVAFMAIVNRARQQDIDSFLASNHAEDIEAGRALLKSMDKFAVENEELTGFIDSIQEIFREIHPELKVVYDEMVKGTGKKPMGKIDWYIPFVRMNQWDDLDAITSQLHSINPKGDAQYRSSTKVMRERQGGSGYIDISDPFGQTYRYINQASTYIAMAPTVKNVSMVLNTNGAQEAMKWKFGTNKSSKFDHKFVDGIMRDLVAGELFHDARIKPMTEAESFINKARSHYTMFALAGNVGTMVKQVLSFPLGTIRSGDPIQTTLRAAGTLASIAPQAFGNSITNMSRFFSGRGGTIGYKHILAGTEIYEKWSRYSNVLLERHGNPETGEAQAHTFRGFMGIEVSGIPLGEAMMAGISAIDALTVGTLWGATFDSWVRLNKSNGMTELEAETDAAEKANTMIRETQPPSLPQENNLMQRGSEWTRSMFLFSGATMKQFEVFSTEILGRSGKAIRDVKTKGYGSLTDVLFKGENLQSGLLMQGAIGFVLPAVVHGILSRRRKPTEEELFADILSYPVAALPVMKSLIGMAVGLDEEKSQGMTTYYDAVVMNTSDGVKAFAKSIYGNNWEPRDIQDMADAIALMANAPKVFSSIVSAAIIDVTGKEDFTATLEDSYIAPWKESKTLK